MTILERIDNDLNESLKAHNLEKATTLRTLKAQLKNVAIETHGDLNDDQVMTVLQKEAKKRREAIEIYKNTEREDLKVKETKEFEIINSYLPELLSNEELVTIVDGAIKESNASSIKDMGKVMGVVNNQTKGRADGSVVAKLVKERLQVE